MNVYSPREYWTGISERFRSADPDGFAPVLHPDAPAWFNRTIDSLQSRAMKRALTLAKVQTGSRFLDVGCGTGRWVRRYAQLGFRPIGIDATAGMLQTAREHGTTPPLTVGWASALPFADAYFDAVSDVTVIQHIHYSLHATCLKTWGPLDSYGSNQGTRWSYLLAITDRIDPECLFHRRHSYRLVWTGVFFPRSRFRSNSTDSGGPKPQKIQRA